MRKLVLSALAIAGLAAGAAFAQSGDAESQAGSAWRTPYAPIQSPPGYANNSGWPPPQEPYVYDHRGYAPYAYRDARPAYPYVRPRRGDRDGDGVPNRRDRHPDDPYRY